MRSGGFSLIELMIALSITLVAGLMVFQLFQQNERSFRDQSLVLEMQQNARVLVSQIVDEVRMAGQGVPVYSTTFDRTSEEAMAVVLNGSDRTHLYIRAGLSGVESSVTAAVPLDLTLSDTKVLAVENAAIFSGALGVAPSSGRFAYVWGPCANESWGWARVELSAVLPAANTITVTPRQVSSSCRAAGSDNSGTVEFSAPPSISLEEVVSLHFDSNSVRRATATNVTVQTSPVWGAAAELAQNVRTLTFTYYSREGNELVPPFTDLQTRLAVSRIDVRAVATTSGRLSNSTQPTFALSARVIPRNLIIR